MTRDTTNDGAIETDAAFETALAATIQRALDGGLDARGAWEVATNGTGQTWEVQIVELARRDDGDGPAGDGVDADDADGSAGDGT
jgi:hypothetical protein